MRSQLELSGFVDLLMEYAHQGYRASPECKTAQVKQKEIDQMVENEFTDTQRGILYDLFDLMNENYASEREFVYKRGLRDCVRILKALEVL